MVPRGFTLVELLALLGISAVLIFLAYPSFGDLMQRVHTTSRVNSLIGLIRFARQSAITQGRWITLCPAVAETCTGTSDWQTGIMVFADHNRDGDRQPSEPLIAYQSRFEPGERLTWRSFRRHNFLQFRSAGYTNFQNGSFLYCPASGESRHGKVIIVNIQGRATPSVDGNGDGVDEQANGKPLVC